MLVVPLLHTIFVDVVGIIIIWFDLMWILIYIKYKSQTIKESQYRDCRFGLNVYFLDME